MCERVDTFVTPWKVLPIQLLKILVSIHFRYSHPYSTVCESRCDHSLVLLTVDPTSQPLLMSRKVSEWSEWYQQNGTLERTLPRLSDAGLRK